jgi:hypothetical protein
MAILGTIGTRIGGWFSRTGASLRTVWRATPANGDFFTRAQVKLAGGIGLALAALYPAIKDTYTTYDHRRKDAEGHPIGTMNRVSTGVMDGLKGFFVRALGFIAGGALFATLFRGLATRFAAVAALKFIPKAIAIIVGGLLGAWAAIKSFPNKAAKIHHHAEEKHDRAELFNTMRDKNLGVVTFSAMPASKLAHSSDEVQNAYFSGMAKQTMDFVTNEKPMHAIFGVKTPFTGTTSPFGAVPYEHGDKAHTNDESAAPEEAHH